MRTILLVAAVLAATTSALAGEPARERLDAKLKECGLFGRAYLRLADYRDQGVEKAIAINRATESMNYAGQTGSHLPSKNHRDAVERFAEYVFGHPEMTRESLFLYGSYDCAFSKLIETDAQYFATQKKLVSTLMACQKTHTTGEAIRKKLAPCVQDGAVKLVPDA